MEIVLQNNVILIRTDYKTMQSSWMSGFLHLHARHMLFLPKAILVFHTQRLFEEKEEFLRRLASYYAASHDLDEAFYMRCLLRCSTQPVRIELNRTEEGRRVRVELYAHDSNTVSVKLDNPNAWVIDYLRSQLDLYVSRLGERSMVLDVSLMQAKTRLERALNKRHILHFQIEYRYDALFMQRLYGDYADFGFDGEEHHEQIDEMMHYYTVLECPVGASQDALKKSYRKLVKVYHPDRVHCEDHTVVDRYTRKFQLLQEAYTALRIVS